MSSQLILASTSRYRHELLSRLRLSFIALAPVADETPLPGEQPLATALRLAKAKAQSLAAHNPDAHIIGSDQVADLDGVALSKPGNHANARQQLQAMRGRSITFHTALAVYDARRQYMHSCTVPTLVQFRHFDDATIEHYLLAEMPYDCAGSAKAEGLGITLIASIQSDDPTALIGLPLIALTNLLQQVGILLPPKFPLD